MLGCSFVELAAQAPPPVDSVPFPKSDYKVQKSFAPIRLKAHPFVSRRIQASTITQSNHSVFIKEETFDPEEETQYWEFLHKLKCVVAQTQHYIGLHWLSFCINMLRPFQAMSEQQRPAGAILQHASSRNSEACQNKGRGGSGKLSYRGRWLHTHEGNFPSWVMQHSLPTLLKSMGKVANERQKIAKASRRFAWCVSYVHTAYAHRHAYTYELI